MRAITLAIVLAAAGLISLFAVSDLAAQSQYNLQPVGLTPVAEDYNDHGCWESWATVYSDGVYLRLEGDDSCSNSKRLAVQPIGAPPPGAVGLVTDYEANFFGTRLNGGGQSYWIAFGARKGTSFATVTGPEGAFTTTVSGRACWGSADVGQFDGLGCDSILIDGSWNDGLAGWEISMGSHSSDRDLLTSNTSWIMTGQTPLANDFGLTCTYTHTGGITQTVSASNVLNASFETFNYGSLPAGWSVHSPGSTFYAATDNSYHGSYSLQYQPNPSRMFAQACRSVQIDTDAQSVAAGVYYAGGTNGTSDVTILLDGSVLGTTLVSGLAPWAPLAVTDTFSSTTQFHTLCVEVEGANRAYIDAVWLYASETNDLSGLICPAPEDNVVPPPPPPPPENDEDGIPVPAPEDLGTCYRCIKPISILQIGSWIKWLFCGLANLFRCELWLWLLQIQNIAAAIFGSFGLFIAWLPGAFQSWIDWGAGAVGGVASWFVGIWDAFRNGFTLFLSGLVQRFLETEFIQDIWAGLTMGRGLAEFLIGIARAFMAMLQALYDAVSQLVELIRGFVAAVAAAWNAEPYQFDFIPGQGAGSGGSGPGITGPELLEADGINNSKIYWLLVVSLLAVDDVAGSFGLQYLQWIAIGILSLGLIGWTFTKWHDPVPT